MFLVAGKTGAEQCCSHTLGNQSSKLRQGSHQALRVLYLRSIFGGQEASERRAAGEGAASHKHHFNNKPPASSSQEPLPNSPLHSIEPV